ncbi:uncharacterized protein LOC143535159 [Bidens hawaiensis]|uniref:uncharacterized protein LOC143535159 n=1 Tax=Bidens hawaiensis TaxID=980011 RepID=UPI004049D5B1
MTDATYEQWEQDDLVVFSWLIQNIEPVLASNLTEFPIAKTLWEALVVTYSSGKDKLQTFNLHVRANEIKQNDASLENLWITLQGIWGEIERIDPNPMKCPEDIQIYTKIRSEQKLFQFLSSLDRKYEPVKREILRSEPLPSAEEAYAIIRKEENHQKILGINPKDEQSGVAAGLIATDPENPNGTGLAAKGVRRPQPPKPDKTHLKCTHCGMTRHTKEECFKIIGYPEWWTNGHKKGNNKDGGKTGATVDNKTAVNDGGFTGKKRGSGGGFGGLAAVVEEEDSDTGKGFEIDNSNPFIRTPCISNNYHSSPSSIFKVEYFSIEFRKLLENSTLNHELSPKTFQKSILQQNNDLKTMGKVNVAKVCDGLNNSWILDCGATDTMTFDISDIKAKSKPTKNHIQTASGEMITVKGGGTVEVSPTLKLSNCLYIPTLSHKLLSISHVTKELNCSVLMHPTFCILQKTISRMHPISLIILVLMFLFR